MELETQRHILGRSERKRKRALRQRKGCKTSEAGDDKSNRKESTVLISQAVSF